MLPKRLRLQLFETLSLKTMRYVHAVPRRKARCDAKSTWESYVLHDDDRGAGTKRNLALEHHS